MLKELNNLQLKATAAIKTNKGIGVKEIAAALGIVVLIGVAFGLVRGQMGTYITWFWDKFRIYIETTFGI